MGISRAVPAATALAVIIGWTSIIAAEGNWPQLRGPGASGFIPQSPPAPQQWDVPAGKNVRWKTPIPGLAHSSPVIWGDQLFLTTAVIEGEEQPLKTGLYGDINSVFDKQPVEWRALCIDRASGKILWQKPLHKGMPRIKRHPKASHANSTPAVDEKRLVAFLGAEGLFCLDHQGKLLWKKDLGDLDSGFFIMPAAQWGFASSPVLHQGRVIVQCDVQKGSFLAAFDADSGDELWRTPREEVPTWSTPTIVQLENGQTQIICNGWKQIAGYDFATGKLIWSLKGGGDIPVPTPVVAHGLAFITNAHGGPSPIYAIRLSSARGDLTLPPDQASSDHIAWLVRRGGNYMQTPIVIGDLLYTCQDSGTLTCWQATTGRQVYREKLTPQRQGFTASPVASAGRLYFTSEDGIVHVIQAGNEFAKLAENPLGEPCMASPAISDGVLYFRARDHLIAIAQP